MPLNVQLLRKIQKAIQAEPGRFDMGWWVDLADDKSPCGTSACIGGYAVILAKVPKLLTKKKWVEAAGRLESEKSFEVWNTARDVLGLDDGQATRLFDEDMWPEEFFNPYKATDNRRKRAKVAIKRIDFFIKTNGTDEVE